jgi:acyl-CoA thioesterase-1
VPFLLDGIEDGTNFQADNVHPTAAAQPRIMENVWGKLQPLLKQKYNRARKN